MLSKHCILIPKKYTLSHSEDDQRTLLCLKDVFRMYLG